MRRLSIFWSLERLDSCCSMPSRRKALILVSIMAIILYSTYALRGVRPQPDALQARARLANAIGAVRPAPGRLVGIEHSPYIPSVRTGLPKRIVAIVREFRRTTEVTAFPQALGDTAVLDLITGNLNQAVLKFKLATSHGSANGRLLSDLSAIYLARGLEEDRALDIFLALDMAERAVQAAPGLPEAHFNLALALNHNFLLFEAGNAWREYLRLDPDSLWAQEARGYLQALYDLPKGSVDWKNLSKAALQDDSDLIRALVARHPQQTRLYGERDLLAGWAEAQARGREAEADQMLRSARRIGQILVEVSGDYMLRDSVKKIDQALNGPIGDKVILAIEGHRAYGEGLSLMAEQQDRRALGYFKQAVKSLSAVGSPFRYRAMMRAASCAKNMLDHRQVLWWLTSIQSDTDAVRYPNLTGEVFWMLGVTHASLANFSSALSLYGAALPLFQRTREEENVAFLNYLMAESLRVQGDTEAAWNHLHKAFYIGRRYPASIYLHNAMLDAAEAALRQGAPKAALRFQNEMVHNSLAGGTLASKVEAFLRRSRTYQLLGSENLVRQDLQEARAWLNQMSQDAIRHRLEAEFAAALGESRLESAPQKAATSLGAAIDLFQKKIPARLPKLLLERGYAWQAVQELEKAEEDFYASIQELEALRSRLLSDQIRDSFFDQVRHAFKAAVELQVIERQNPRRGFLDVERLHNFLVSGYSGTGSAIASSSSIENLQAQLPHDVSVVEYFIGEQNIFVWILDRDGLYFTELLVDQDELKREVILLQDALAKRASALEVAPLSEHLYDVLLRPITRRFELRRTLIIIPDAWLYLIPFAGLLDNVSGRYLVEDRILGIAPSAAAYSRNLLQGREPRIWKGSRMLVIGNPAFDRRRFPKLSNLPGAEQEARRTAALYDADLLIGRHATKSILLNKVFTYDVIHWAGHAEVHPDLSLLSYLLLAPESPSPLPGDTGILYAHEIQRIHFTRTQLIVLAACWSMEGAKGTGEGLSGLAQAFLSAGVPNVVSYLGPLKDGEAIEFMTNFHNGLRAGKSPLLALHSTQIAALSHSDRRRKGSAAWIGFQILVGPLMEN